MREKPDDIVYVVNGPLTGRPMWEKARFNSPVGAINFINESIEKNKNSWDFTPDRSCYSISECRVSYSVIDDNVFPQDGKARYWQEEHHVDTSDGRMGVEMIRGFRIRGHSYEPFSCEKRYELECKRELEEGGQDEK